MIRRSNLLLLVLALTVLAGCVEDRNASAKEALKAPWPETGAPERLMALADDLLAYQAAAGRMPNTLEALDKVGIATGGPYRDHNYAYHPANIGILREGWRVLAVDDRVQEKEQVWCVVRAPMRVSGAPALRLVLVPMGELRIAGSMAGVK